MPAARGWPGGLHLHSTAGEIAARQVVICAGAASAPLFGDRVPLLAERGYHACFEPGTEALLSGTTCFAGPGQVLAPMTEGLRLTMGAELSRPGCPPDFRRLRSWIAAARDLVPALPGPRFTGNGWASAPRCPTACR